MRVGVLGAGAVGGTLAALLDRAGHDVQVTARGEHLQAIERFGLRLSGEWGHHVARVPSGGILTEAPDLAILATKAVDAEAALAPNAELLDGIPLVVVQNGLTGTETASAAVPTAAVIGGLALFAASIAGPGEVTVTTAAGLCLGGTPGDPALDVAAGLLGAVLPVTTTDDLRATQWTKLVINQVNALPAITGSSVQEVAADARLRRILTRSMQEAVRAALEGGERLAPLQGLDERLLRRFSRAPLAIAQRLPKRMAAGMGSVPNPASTLQSIRRGSATEVDYLNGAVVDAAERAGVPAPVNRAMVELVHEVEQTGRFLDADDVVRRVPKA